MSENCHRQSGFNEEPNLFQKDYNSPNVSHYCITNDVGASARVAGNPRQ